MASMPGEPKDRWNITRAIKTTMTAPSAIRTEGMTPLWVIPQLSKKKPIKPPIISDPKNAKNPITLPLKLNPWAKASLARNPHWTCDLCLRVAPV